MKVLRRTIAFLYGFALMYFVAIWFTGFMAARQVPPGYFRLFASFGETGKVAALAVLGFLLHLIPDLLLLGAGIFIATVTFTQERRAVGLMAILGAALSYCLWSLVYSMPGHTETWSFFAVLAPYIHSPWWSWPSSAAPALGLVLAYVLLPRMHSVRTGA